MNCTVSHTILDQVCTLYLNTLKPGILAYTACGVKWYRRWSLWLFKRGQVSDKQVKADVALFFFFAILKGNHLNIKHQHPRDSTLQLYHVI